MNPGASGIRSVVQEASGNTAENNDHHVHFALGYKKTCRGCYHLTWDGEEGALQKHEHKYARITELSDSLHEPMYECFHTTII